MDYLCYLQRIRILISNQSLDNSEAKIVVLDLLTDHYFAAGASMDLFWIAYSPSNAVSVKFTSDVGGVANGFKFQLDFLSKCTH